MDNTHNNYEQHIQEADILILYKNMIHTGTVQICLLSLLHLSSNTLIMSHYVLLCLQVKKKYLSDNNADDHHKFLWAKWEEK